MAEGTTLERLQVIIEANATRFKKEIENITEKTQKVGSVVDKTMSRINSIVGKLNVDSTGKSIETLTNKLNRQREAVDQQSARIQNLRRKILDLESGDVKSATLSGLERQLKAAEKELAAADKQMQPLLDKLTALENEKGEGLSAYQNSISKLTDEARELGRERDRLYERGRALKAVKLGSVDAAEIKSAKVQLKQLGEEVARVGQRLQAKMRELHTVKFAEPDFSSIDSETAKIENQIDQLQPKYQELEDRVDSLRQKLEEAKLNPDGTAEAQKLNGELELAVKKLERLEGEADQTEQKIAEISDSSARTKGSIGSWGTAVNKVHGLLTKVSSKIDKIFSGFTKTKKSIDRCASSTDVFQKGLNKVNRLMRLLFMRSIMSGIRSGLTDAFQNIARYSSECNQSISLLMSSLIQLRNAVVVAVMPLMNAFAPALNTIIRLAVTAANAVAQFFAALTGSGTYLKAVGINKDYAAGLDATGTAAKNAAKEIKNATLGIDELNVIQKEQGDTASGSTGGTDYGDMFETEEVENKYKDLADKIRDLLDKFFTPLKEAWNREGQFVMESWNYALQEVWQLIKDIGRDFLIVWNQEATIQMFADILRIIGDIGLVIGNIAHGLDEAWNKNETGKKILEDIRDIFAVIVCNIREAADYTVEWSGKLDFSPLLEAFERFSASLVPVADNLSGILTDFYTNVLLPLGQWTLEKGLPELLDIFTQFNEKVDWESLRSNLDEFWKKLEPFAETVGEGLLIFLEDLSNLVANFLNSETLENFLDHLAEWMDSVEPEDAATGIEKLAKALVLLKVAVVALDGVIAASKIAVALTSIGKGVESIVKVASGIGTAMSAVGNFVSYLTRINPNTIVVLGSRLVDQIKGTFLDPFEWDNIIGDLLRYLAGVWERLWGGVYDLFDNFGVNLKTALETLFDLKWVQELFEKAKEHFSEAFKGEDIGLNIVQGLFYGISSALGLLLAPIVNLFMSIIDGVLELFGIHSPSTVFYEMGGNIIQGLLNGLQESWQGIMDWWTNTAIYTWWEEGVKPWFSLETWFELAQGILDGLTEKWNEVTEWWRETAIFEWWENDVKPWFSLETWSILLTNIKTSFKTKWDETVKQWKTGIENWWKEHVEPWFTKERWLKLGENLKNGIYEGFKGLANKVIDVLNGVISALESMVNSAIDGINSLLDKLNASPLGKMLELDFSVSTVTFGRIPQFEAGGFPNKGSLFIANEAGPELVGRIGSRSAVANTDQIIEGITAGVESGNTAVVDALLRVIELLTIIAEKDPELVFDTQEGLKALRERQLRNGVSFV
ncbi:MAG: hypothetical protein Q4C58_14235 [Eubacteriales bacterium]|nr:hypothetical protein [Eubacteriales bacterium]